MTNTTHGTSHTTLRHPLHPADCSEAGRQPSLAAAIEPVLVDQAKARMICGGLSSATWQRLKAADKLPGHVRIGGRVFYRLDDLKLWTRLGCPDRKEFETRKS